MLGIRKGSARSRGFGLPLLTGVAILLTGCGEADGSARGGDVPTPESAFGFPVGADYQLFDYEQSIAYFEQLAAASDHIQLIDVGWTSFGRPWKAALISSPGNLARLDYYRELNQRLAHPEGLTDDEARALTREGRIIVDISGGLHASETAGAQHTAQLAWELLSTTDDPATQEIMDNVIFFLWPTINPDGQEIVVDWCRARDAGEDPAPMELYQRYIGHDNNRDSYMLNVVESRVIQRVWREWEPGIIYVHHQSSPFPTRIWLPPFADPVGLHAPPIPARTVNTIGMAIAQELDANDQPGAVHGMTTFDAWYLGYIDYMPLYQHIPAWWSETQGGNCATPRTSTVDSLPAAYRDLRPTPLYLSPWDGGTWGLRDAVEYMVTASKATLRYAARNREDMLFNRYRSGRNVIEKYRAQPPYAYIVPQDQRDPVAPVELLQRMAFMGIGIDQATEPFTYAGVEYPAGTWVVPMDQEYGELARSLLEVQAYPDIPGGRPYDAAGWTLPYQLGVDVVEGDQPLTAEVRSRLQPVRGTPVDWRDAPEAPFTTNPVAAGIVPLEGGTTGEGPTLLVDPVQNNSFRLLNRARAAGGSAVFTPATAAGGARYRISGVPEDSLRGWADELAVRGEFTAAAGADAQATAQRIALYKGAPGNMDQGWTEWLLDTHDFDYTLATPDDLLAGDLRQRYDVLILASQTLARGGFRGGGAGSPDPEEAARREALNQAVDAFVREGGTVVAWTAAIMPLVEALSLPVENRVAGVSRDDFFTGISILQVQTDPTHRAMAGMPAQADVVVAANSPVLVPTAGFQGTVLARYADSGSPLRSGWLNGEEYLHGGAAALDLRHGRGHVILFAYQPQWRGQPIGSFRSAFNAFLFADAPASGGAPGAE